MEEDEEEEEEEEEEETEGTVARRKFPASSRGAIGGGLSAYRGEDKRRSGASLPVFSNTCPRGRLPAA